MISSISYMFYGENIMFCVPGGRRIGSGRIMVRDTPNNTWEEGEYRGSEPYRPPREREREHVNERRTNNNDR